MTDCPQTSNELADAATAVLEKLVSFDTTSRNSNLELIDYVESTLSELGANTARVPSPDERKANLYATFGPPIDGGVMLSGHTDVVPVDGQNWTSDPFRLSERDGRLHGRGTTDMKSFLALMVAAAPLLAATDRLKRQATLVFTYDEEIGCFGAPRVIDKIARDLPQPAAVVVGEPTNLKVVRANKGISVWKVTITGHPAHSSRTDCGVSANMVAVDLMLRLAGTAANLKNDANTSYGYEPPEATLTIGRIDGGTAANILAGRCEFLFDLRCLPGMDPDEIVAPIMAEVARADRQLRARFPETGVRVERITDTPALSGRCNSEAEQFVRGLAGDNGPASVASFAAEAGQFEEAGFPTVLCGPGSIEQAHQTDEYIEKDQIERGANFMLRLTEYLSKP